MFLLEKNQALTTDTLSKILAKFNTQDRPLLQEHWDYFQGKQKILQKQATDVGKPCNKVVVNYCSTIVNNYLGYLAGIPITYENDNFDEVKDILKYNDYPAEDSELLRNALIYGVAYELNYIDEDSKQRFRILDSRECVPVYDNTLNNDLLYVIRYYEEKMADDLTNTNYIVEVYGNYDTKIYRSSAGFSSFQLIQELPNFYTQCPVTVFSLNNDETSIFSQIVSLQDSYNMLVSAALDDVESFADAYLVLKGCTADNDDLIKMKQNRVLVLDNDASADYLTKTITDTQVQNLLANLNSKIHSISNSPDFNDPNFASAASGIALRLKLIGFENTASAIESQMRRALTKRVELISEILKLTDAEYVWRDTKIKFTRNLPYDITEAVNTVNALRGVVSERTLLSLLPFVTDVDAELEAVKAEKLENMDLYSFSNVNAEEEITIENSLEGKLPDEE